MIGYLKVLKFVFLFLAFPEFDFYGTPLFQN